MDRGSAWPRGPEALETIHTIAEIVHGSLDFETVAERAAAAIIDYTPFMGVSIFVVDESGDTLELVAFEGFSDELAASGGRVPVRGSFMGLALEQCEVVTSEDLRCETRGVSALREALVRDGFQKAICVPLIHADTALGVVNLVVRGDREVADVERRTLKSISDTIAMALVNAKYVDRIEREVNQRKASEERYALATSAAKVGVWDWNPETEDLHLDPNTKALLGYSDDEIASDLRTWNGLVHPDDRDMLKTTIEDHLTGRTSQFACEHRMMHKDGTVRWIMARGHAKRDAEGKVYRVIGTNTDITDRKQLEDERRQLEKQILHAEKLKSLGVLAGGIAHDFNNLLTSILGNAGLALSQAESDARARPFIEHIETAARRAADLTRQLLAYSGRGMFVLEPIDVAALVQEMTELLRLSISKKAVLKYELTENLPRLEGDPGQLRQVIMNLITNASEALGDEPGSVYVRTGVTDVDPRRPPDGLMWKNLAGGEYVYFEVADSGCGMDPVVQTKIFDPFFTTKFTGRGLGLAAVQGIVRSHGGGIELESSPGHGTRVRVLLPVTERRGHVVATERSGATPDLGGGTVLVIDDEEEVRRFVTTVLTKAGFTVLTAADGHAGLETYKDRWREIRLVIVDLTMPRIGGEEVLPKIREIHPDARVILTSGYSAIDVAGRVDDVLANAFLEKPYMPDTLVDTVRRALD
jgi:PAS domain S-box-containing protein